MPKLPSAPRDDGFTIGETLISLLLTLVVMTGAIETFTRAMTLFGTSRVMSETNHGLQAGMSLLVRDVMQTGQGIPLGGIPIPSDPGDGQLAIARPGPFANQGFPKTTTLPALSPGSSLGPNIFGVATDIMTILYADQTLFLNQYPLIAIAANGTTMTVDNRTPVTGVNGIKEGDLILFSNSQGSALQYVTATPNNQTVTFGANDPLNVNQRNEPQGTILNLQSPVNAYPPTTARRVLMVSSYINQTDPTLPRLVRRVNAGQPLAIAMGLENFQVTYDIVDGVTNPTNVDTPPGGTSPNMIRKANLFLSARSQEINPQTKKVFRNSMATQVGLRSLSFRDKYK